MPQGRAKIKSYGLPKHRAYYAAKIFLRPALIELPGTILAPLAYGKVRLSLLSAPIFVLRLLNSKVRILPFRRPQGPSFSLGRRSAAARAEMGNRRHLALLCVKPILQHDICALSA